MSRLRGKEAALFPKVIRHVWVCAGQGVTIAFFRTSLSRHNKSGFALDVSGFSHAQKLRCFFLVNVIESIYLPGLTDWGDFQSSVAVSIGIFDKTLLIWKIVQTKVKGHWLRLMRPNSTLTVRLSHAFLLASRRAPNSIYLDEFARPSANNAPQTWKYTSSLAGSFAIRRLAWLSAPAPSSMSQLRVFLAQHTRLRPRIPCRPRATARKCTSCMASQAWTGSSRKQIGGVRQAYARQTRRVVSLCQASCCLTIIDKKEQV
jgi:hypothetical protein